MSEDKRVLHEASKFLSISESILQKINEYSRQKYLYRKQYDTNQSTTENSGKTNESMNQTSMVFNNVEVDDIAKLLQSENITINHYNHNLSPYFNIEQGLDIISQVIIQNSNIWSHSTRQYQLDHRFSEEYDFNIPTSFIHSEHSPSPPFQSISSHPSQDAVVIYGRIMHKLRMCRQLELSKIQLKQKLSIKLLECIKLFGYSKLKSLREDEFYLLIELLSLGQKIDGDKTIDNHRNESVRVSKSINNSNRIKTNSVSRTNGERKSRISYTESRLEELRQQVENQMEQYRRYQRKTIQSKHDEVLFVKLLSKIHHNIRGPLTSLMESSASSKITTDNIFIQERLRLDVQNTVPILATIEPLLHRLVHSNDLTLPDILKINSMVDQEFLSFRFPTTSPPKINYEDMEYQHYSNLFYCPPLGVEEALMEMRQRHKQMLQRIVKACEPFCPYDIIVSPS